MKVRELIARNGEIPTCTANDTVADTALRMRLLREPVFLVVDEPGSRHLEGIVTEDDLLAVAVHRFPTETAVATCMHWPRATCALDDDVTEALRRSDELGVAFLPVVDAANVCFGVVSRGELEQASGRARRAA